MNLHLKEIVVIVLLVFAIGWGISASFRYSKLKQEYTEYKNENSELVDSLREQVSNKESLIRSLESEVLYLNDSINSIEVKKIYIEKQTFKVSENISEASILLKENLSCVEL